MRFTVWIVVEFVCISACIQILMVKNDVLLHHRITQICDIRALMQMSIQQLDGTAHDMYTIVKGTTYKSFGWQTFVYTRGTLKQNLTEWLRWFEYANSTTHLLGIRVFPIC